jgi:hypothetical protein
MRYILSLTITIFATATSAEDNLPAQARATLEKAVAYFTSKVATHGGYLWEYTPDLKERWGEGKATETQIWVQPPGTPSVGQALLHAYKATGDERYWKAARRGRGVDSGTARIRRLDLQDRVRSRAT